MSRFNRGRKRAVNPLHKQQQVVVERLRRKVKLRKKYLEDGHAFMKRNSRVALQDPQELQREIDDLTQQIKAECEKMYNMPASLHNDPSFRRLRYVRYADDFLLGMIASREEAEEVQKEIILFLENELRLKTSPSKTGIKSAKDGTTFLSYHIVKSPDRVVRRHRSGGKTVRKQRSAGSAMLLSVPKDKILKFAKQFGNFEAYRALHMNSLVNLTELEILMHYNMKLRGFVGYYSLAYRVKNELNKVHRFAMISWLKTVAAKRKTSIAKVARFYKTNNAEYALEHEGESYKFFLLKHLKKPDLTDASIDFEPVRSYGRMGTDLARRWAAQECEFCGKKDGYLEVHHVRKLADLKGKSYMDRVMIARQRKTRVLCIECHDLLHAGKLPDSRYMSMKANS
jgi:RNA-directed DNA polymerase